MSQNSQENAEISQKSGKEIQFSGNDLALILPATHPQAETAAKISHHPGKAKALSEAELAVCVRIAAFIKETRLHIGHVAKAINMSASSVDNVVNFRNAPSAKMLIGLRSVYDLDMNDTLLYASTPPHTAGQPATPEVSTDQVIRSLTQISSEKDEIIRTQQEQILLLREEISRLKTINQHLKTKSIK